MFLCSELWDRSRVKNSGGRYKTIIVTIKLFEFIAIIQPVRNVFHYNSRAEKKTHPGPSDLKTDRNFYPSTINCPVNCTWGSKTSIWGSINPCLLRWPQICVFLVSAACGAKERDITLANDFMALKDYHRIDRKIQIF